MISKCLESRSKKGYNDDDDVDFYRKMSHIAPFEVADLNQVQINETLNKFYCIPNEGQTDKVIEWLDEVPVFTEKEMGMLNDLIVELESLRKKYRPALLYVRRETQASKSVFGLLDAKNTSTESHDGVKLSGSFYSNDSRDHSSEDKNKPHFMVEVQSAKFLHESRLQKHSLKNPYVVVKIYKKPYVRMDTSGPLPNSMIKTLKTQKNMEPVEPKWDELFRYYLDLENQNQNQEKTLSTYSAGISLYYSGRKNEEDWRVGEEQHFSFSSLLDQRMQSKVIDFKDAELKGVLAKLHIKIQLICDREQVISRVLHEIDIRLEKLGKLKQKQSSSSTRSQGDKSHDSSMLDHSQSMMSAYSCTGLKANDYYIV